VRQNIQIQYLSVRSFFVFNERNKKNIFQNLFFLVRWGFTAEYLSSIPLEDFYYYVQLFNKNKGTLGIDSVEDNVTGASIPPAGADPKPIGEVSPPSALLK